MRKITALCLAAMLLIFAGCGNEKENEITTQPETEITTASAETEAVTAMGNIIITKADTVFEEKTTAEEPSETKEITEEITETKTEASETEIPETEEVQYASYPDTLIGGWQYVYEDSGYMLIERIYLNADGSAAYGYGIYAGEYIGQYEGIWYENNGTVYLDLVGGGSDWDDEEERTVREQNKLTMQLDWEKNADGITFIDYEDVIVIGDAPGSSYNFVTSEI